MANVITSFLVGIGYDTEQLQRGEREIARSMDGVKSLAGTTGAALGAAFIGVGKTAMDTADRVNSLRLSTNQLYTSTTYVNDYGNALRTLGGDAGDAVGEISRVETALSNLRQKGDASTFTELAYYGVDVNPLQNADSGGQFMEQLAQQFPNLNRQQQSGVASTLGLSPATVELLRKGGDGYRTILGHAHDVAGLTDDLIKKSQDYNAALGEAQLKWQGIANTISSAVLPDMTSIVNKGSEILTNVVQPMAERAPVETGAGLSMLGAGVAGSVAAPLLGSVGLGGVGALAGAVAPPVALAGAGTLAWNMNQQDVKNLTGKELPSWLWDKKVFDESKGDAAGGLLHRGSFLDNLFKKNNTGIFDDSKGDSLGGLWHSDNALSRWWKTVDTTPPALNPNDGYYKRTFGNRQKNNVEQRGWDAGDAVEQSYEAEKMTYMNSASYAPEAAVNDYNSAAATGDAIAEKLYKVPLKADVKVTNDIRMELDGRALDNKITEVQQRNNQMTVDDMQSTTSR